MFFAFGLARTGVLERALLHVFVLDFFLSAMLINGWAAAAAASRGVAVPPFGSFATLLRFAAFWIELRTGVLADFFTI